MRELTFDEKIFCWFWVIIAIATLATMPRPKDGDTMGKFCRENKSFTDLVKSHNKEYKAPTETSEFKKMELEFDSSNNSFLMEAAIENYVSNVGGVLKEISDTSRERATYTTYTILVPRGAGVQDEKELKGLLQEFHRLMWKV